jgi:hypothetical protein
MHVTTYAKRMLELLAAGDDAAADALQAEWEPRFSEEELDQVRFELGEYRAMTQPTHSATQPEALPCRSDHSRDP